MEIENKKFACIKRFFEKYLADPKFRKDFEDHPEEIIKKFNMGISYEFLKNTLRNIINKRFDKTNFFIKILKEKEEIQKQVWNDLVKKEVPFENFQKWRTKQLNRIKKIFPPNSLHTIGNLAIAYELSNGCSGKCPFCCLDPQPLSKIYYFNKKNVKLWEKVLEISLKLLGDLARYSICYFATEPFDNPFYEKFAQIFRKINGFWPHLTTIKHIAEKDRIKKHLKEQGDEIKKIPVRFSIISLEMLYKVHKIYSPEELEDVNLLLLNPESPFKYALAGRARKLFNNKNFFRKKFLKNTSPICITGFVVNMPRKEIKLISPTIPNNKFPYGYIEFGKEHFKDEKEYEEKLYKLVENVSN